MGESQIHGIKDLYTEEQANIRNFQGHEDYNEGTSNDVIEIITDLEDVLADATTSDNAKVIPTNGGKKQKLSELEEPYNIANTKKRPSGAFFYASDDLEEIDTETLLGKIILQRLKTTDI
ncbi:hypothetical protein RhiirC2_788974 [Rhizophagus irregularis]|uniref:Uncharacterized protein n=1 Tax=Rhizophagus irregularis TaxID=588596 RepID=A0A2N1MP41_9GLOM|nr:hypothetical protein RhiirC2_788974 [Rhizophagus irregularis]